MFDCNVSKSILNLMNFFGGGREKGFYLLVHFFLFFFSFFFSSAYGDLMEYANGDDFSLK